MKIHAKREKIKNMEYGSVIYELNDFGFPMKDNPMLVLNTETKTGEDVDFVFVASLDDGAVSTIDDDVIVELADVSLTINQY